MDKGILDRILQGVSPCDNAANGALLKVFRPDPEAHAYVRRTIMRRRRDWLTWLIHRQHDWQSSDRNRHHDSFELREKYIAPHNDFSLERSFMRAARVYNSTRRPDLFVGRTVDPLPISAS